MRTAAETSCVPTFVPSVFHRPRALGSIVDAPKYTTPPFSKRTPGLLV
jgi:hypothetical protein